MTVDEYIRKLCHLEKKVNKLDERLQELQSRLLSSGSSFRGMPAGAQNENGYENRLIEYLDASKEWQATYEEYGQYRDQLHNAKYNILHWQALVIERIYETNPIFEYPDKLYGVGLILDTKDRHVIRAKADEAKSALGAQLRAQGVEIE